MERITQNRLRELLHYDPLTGVFTRLVKTAACVNVGDIAGSKETEGYLRIFIDGRSYKAHVLAWLYMHGVWPDKLIDHKDTIRHHNWLTNLRPATRSENGQNMRKATARSKTGLLGVSWDKKMKQYRADIMIGKKQVRLGFFGQDETAASNAYLAAKLAHHPFQTLVVTS